MKYAIHLIQGESNIGFSYVLLVGKQEFVRQALSARCIGMPVNELKLDYEFESLKQMENKIAELKNSEEESVVLRFGRY